MRDENLPVAMFARADSDRWNPDRVGDSPGRVRRDNFQHDRKGARCFNRARILQQALRLHRAASFHFITALLAHALGQHADMRHEWNPCPDDCRDLRRMAGAAFELHRLGARVHQTPRIRDRCLGVS